MAGASRAAARPAGGRALGRSSASSAAVVHGSTAPCNLVPEGYSPVRTDYLNFGEALFGDEEGKDVRLQAKDGTAMAHSSVLRAVSKPFQQMLAGDMAEGRSKTVDLPDMTQAELMFFLRLLYTGQVDEGDWGGMSGTPSYVVTVPDDAEPASAGLLNGSYVAAGNFRGAPKFLNGNQVLLYRGSNEEAGGPYWKLSWKEDEDEDDDDEDDEPDPRLEHLWAHADVGEEIPDHLIGWDFSQKGGTASAPPTGTWTHDKGVGIWGSPGKHPVAVIKVDNPPLGLLLAALGFAKKYIVEYMVRWLMEATWDRLNTTSFEQILATAIHLDIAPLRLRCLRFAENNAAIRARYESNSVTEPLVAFELQAIWPRRETKRRRVF